MKPVLDRGCTTEDLIRSIPKWVQIGALVYVDRCILCSVGNCNCSEMIGIIIEYYVLDVDILRRETIQKNIDEEIEDLLHYGEWLTCTLLVRGEVMETDINTINEIK